jgi:hypothetical protein
MKLLEVTNPDRKFGIRGPKTIFFDRFQMRVKHALPNSRQLEIYRRN